MSERRITEIPYVFAFQWGLFALLAAIGTALSPERIAPGTVALIATGIGWIACAIIQKIVDSRGVTPTTARLGFRALVVVTLLSLVCVGFSVGLIIEHGFTVNLDFKPGETYHVSIGGLLLVLFFPTVCLLVSAMSAYASFKLARVYRHVAREYVTAYR